MALLFYPHPQTCLLVLTKSFPFPFSYVPMAFASSLEHYLGSCPNERFPNGCSY